MKHKWYINRIPFRILFPVAAGIMLYLAMLMVFGNLDNLSESFFSQEALFIVVLTYLNHELAIFILGRPVGRRALEGSGIFPKIAYSLFMLSAAAVLDSVIILAYFILVLNYYFFLTELVTIDILMVLFQLMVHLYYLGMLNIRRSNDLSVKKEEMERRQLEMELESFKSEINPGLLMECLESLVILMHEDVQESDRYIQTLANQYRYLLGSRKKDFVPLEEELRAAGELVYLLNRGGDRRIILESEPAGEELLLIPGTLHSIINSIGNSMILDSMEPLTVKIQLGDSGKVRLRHLNRARLVPGPAVRMDKLEQSYLHYTGKGIARTEGDKWVDWEIPRLPEIANE